MSDITYDVIKSFGVLSETSRGWTKELRLISWNGREPKYDIREWSPKDEDGDQKMGKGITISEAEMQELKELIKDLE